MTNTDLTLVHRNTATIDQVIDTYGASKVLVAALRALLRRTDSLARRPRPPDASHLSGHLRHDIGLPPVPQTRRLEITILSGRF